MKGVIQAVTFHPDWYLDHRRPCWATEEQRGWVRYCPDTEVVYVHGDHALHIIDVLTWTRRPLAAEARR